MWSVVCKQNRLGWSVHSGPEAAPSVLPERRFHMEMDAVVGVKGLEFLSYKEEKETLSETWTSEELFFSPAPTLRPIKLFKSQRFITAIKASYTLKCNAMHRLIHRMAKSMCTPDYYIHRSTLLNVLLQVSPVFWDGFVFIQLKVWVRSGADFRDVVDTPVPVPVHPKGVSVGFCARSSGSPTPTFTLTHSVFMELLCAQTHGHDGAGLGLFHCSTEGHYKIPASCLRLHVMRF